MDNFKQELKEIYTIGLRVALMLPVYIVFYLAYIAVVEDISAIIEWIIGR